MFYQSFLMLLSISYTDTHFDHAEIAVPVIAWCIQHVLGSYWHEAEEEIFFIEAIWRGFYHIFTLLLTTVN